ncbi:14-3-3-like protein GF14 epsilon isoform X2 [Amborella trichopoda]|uniref:14-3-3-like protein GF14 epsilon isoform X2 n=1 Tax=Amborella trichopoda TaxID=13333 RepID=UPI0009BD6B5F|nr:14-3-3-like protein GF14 epsilon isoform X2 [Amborella trichopoda]|eukprot:XP_020517951.1 14-3-3-like protein GF14 epsilon isoform X2 [Amborella trichopoda]
MAREPEAQKPVEHWLSLAKAAFKFKSFDVMVDFMKKAVQTIEKGGDEARRLNEEERRLLCTSYMMSVYERLISWQNEMSRPHGEVDPEQLEAIKHKISTIESEIVSICSEFHVLIDKHFILTDNSVEEDVIAYSLKGDLDCYVAEVRPDAMRKFTAACEARLSFQIAANIATAAGPIISGSTSMWLDNNFSLLTAKFFNTKDAKRDFREYVLNWCEINKEASEGNELDLDNLPKSEIKRNLYRFMVVKAILDENYVEEEVQEDVPVPVPPPENVLKSLPSAPPFLNSFEDLDSGDKGDKV